MAFLTLRNLCLRLRPTQEIRLDYQRSHCLTFTHRNCPVLLELSTKTLPPEFPAYLDRRRLILKILSVASVFTLLAITFYLV